MSKRADAGDHVVILGAGQAGVQLADSLRQLGFRGSITLIGEELSAPYQRPPLSKDFLALAEHEPDVLPLRAGTFFEENGIELRVGVRAESVDREAKAVALSDGTRLHYTYLVFATGARNRFLTVPGSDLSGVLSMRTLTDAQSIRDGLKTATRAVVIGAGFIGLEFAASAAKRGIAVTVIEMADRPMQRVLTPAMSEYFVGVLARSRVDVRYGVTLAAIRGEEGTAIGVDVAPGESVPADIVVVGIGVIPNDELAAACDLETSGGIVVDAALQTADPAVFAIGDCALYPNVYTGGMARLESVQNATDHARHLAARIVRQEPVPYREVPWFWTQQGEIKLLIVGVGAPDLDTIARGNVSADKFSLFGFRGEELVCVESVNSSADHVAARRMLEAGKLPTRSQISDPSFDLKAFSKRVALPS